MKPATKPWLLHLFPPPPPPSLLPPCPPTPSLFSSVIWAVDRRTGWDGHGADTPPSCQSAFNGSLSSCRLCRSARVVLMFQNQTAVSRWKKKDFHGSVNITQLYVRTERELPETCEFVGYLKALTVYYRSGPLLCALRLLSTLPDPYQVHLSYPIRCGHSTSSIKSVHITKAAWITAHPKSYLNMSPRFVCLSPCLPACKITLKTALRKPDGEAEHS